MTAMTPQAPADTAVVPPGQARRLFRGGLGVPTAGWCEGFAQANLIAVPRDLAYDMLLFGQRNPRPCPVLDVTEPGDPHPLGLAPEADLRTDLPRYRVWRDGELAGEVTDATRYWREDMVAFLLGCSFTFEYALLQAGIPVRHLEQGRNIPMYRTSLACRPAGRLGGPLVVSMRPVPRPLVPLAAEVTGRYPRMHGPPVHHGDPREVGIADLDQPDYGDPVEMETGDVPVFWACGVTPQAAVTASRPPFAISHAPGHMFITDKTHDSFAA